LAARQFQGLIEPEAPTPGRPTCSSGSQSLEHGPRLRVFGTLGKDTAPAFRRTGPVPSLLGQNGQVTKREMAVVALVEAARIIGADNWCQFIVRAQEE
jgi:hypothetical protein